MKADFTQRDENGRGIVARQPISAAQVAQSRHLRHGMTAADRRL